MFTTFSLLLLSMLTMMSGTAIVASLPLMSEHFADIPHIDLYVKLLLTMPALMVAIISPLSGMIIDKFGRLFSVYFGLTLFVSGGTLGYLIDNFWIILAGRAVMGVGVAFLMTATTTLVGDYFKDQNRHKFMGLQSAFNGLGGIIFISGGGFLAALSWKHPFLIYFIPLLFLPFLLKGLYEPSKATHLDADIDARVFDKKFVLIYISAFFMMILFYILPTQIPFLLSHHYGQSPAQVGMMIATAMGVSALSAMQYKRLRSFLTIKAIFAVLFVLFGTGLFILSQSHTMPGFYGGAIFNGMGMGMMMVNVNAWMLEQAPEKLRGRISGMTVSFMFLGQFASPLIFEPIIARTSLPLLLMLIAILSLLIGLLIALRFRTTLTKRI